MKRRNDEKEKNGAAGGSMRKRERGEDGEKGE